MTLELMIEANNFSWKENLIIFVGASGIEFETPVSRHGRKYGDRCYVHNLWYATIYERRGLQVEKCDKIVYDCYPRYIGGVKQRKHHGNNL